MASAVSWESNCIEVTTDQPLELALFEFVQLRQRRAKRRGVRPVRRDREAAR